MRVQEGITGRRGCFTELIVLKGFLAYEPILALLYSSKRVTCMAARLQFRYWKDKVLNNLLSLRWRLSRNKNVSVGEWHFQAARGRRNCFLERQVTAAGGQGGWLATRLTPAAQVQFWASSPRDSIHEIESRLLLNEPRKQNHHYFLQHLDSTRDLTEKQTKKIKRRFL